MQVEEIRQQLEKGDTQCLEFMFREYGAFCIANLRKDTGCEQEDAEDIFVDAVLIFRNNVLDQKIGELANMRAYIMGICRNTYRSRYRKQMVRQRKSEELRELMYENDKDVETLIIMKESDEEMRKSAFSTFEALSESCQQILRYYYVDKYSMAEIADLMSFTSDKVAKTAKYRCHKKWLELIKSIGK